MDRPNILLVVLDSARADRLSCCGHDRPTTPNLDRLAGEGTLFTNCWSESSWTLPASTTLMTGLAPREHLSDHHRELPRELPTLTEAMRGAGYATLMCSGNAFLGPSTGLDRAFDRTHLARAARAPWKPFINYLLNKGWSDRGGEELTRSFLSFAGSAREPWFGVVWYNDCHHPYMGPGEYRARFLHQPMAHSRRLELVERMRNMQELAATLTDEDRHEISDLYDGALAYTDHVLGALRDGLEQGGRWDDTVVIVAGDHGEMLGEHGLTGHGGPAGMYRPLLRVPLIVRAPDMVPADRRSGVLVQLADVTETIARIGDCLDALPGTAADRLDLRGAATGEGREHAVSERAAWTERDLKRARRRSPHFDFAPFTRHMAAWLQDGWELVTAETGRNELYHLAEDPEESRDLIDDEPEQARLMREALREWQKRVLPHPAAQGHVEREPPAVREGGEAMGEF